MDATSSQQDNGDSGGASHPSPLVTGWDGKLSLSGSSAVVRVVTDAVELVGVLAALGFLYWLSRA